MGLLVLMVQETVSHASVPLGMKDHLAQMILMSVSQTHVLMLEFVKMGLTFIIVHVLKVSLGCFLVNSSHIGPILVNLVTTSHANINRAQFHCHQEFLIS